MILDLFRLDGKTAIVTGASRGLGQGMAVALAEAGTDVALLSTNKSNLQQTAELIAKYNRKALQISCDVTKKEDIKNTIDSVMKEFGRIDILVNNAGIQRRAPAEEFTDEDWDIVMDTNLKSVFRLCRDVGNIMLKQGSGKIINIASLLSFSGGITVPAYTASKGGVAQLTKAFANEWASKNIQVNAIAPGYFDTNNTEALVNDPVRNRQISERIPAGRWGNPNDMKGAVVFLASSASDYVNGHILMVDGGWMAR
jgi:2-deoxy-D-gluconate 3-dehydrogenase